MPPPNAERTAAHPPLSCPPCALPLPAGALHSRDEQHSAFRRAMEDAAPVAKSVARGGKGGARSPRRRGAVAPSPPPPHVQARATGVAEHTAQLNSAASPQRGTVQHSEGVLLSLRKRQAERQADQASMQQLADRLRGSRWAARLPSLLPTSLHACLALPACPACHQPQGRCQLAFQWLAGLAGSAVCLSVRACAPWWCRMGGRPPPDPKTGLGRVLEIAVGRCAAGWTRFVGRGGSTG